MSVAWWWSTPTETDRHPHPERPPDPAAAAGLRPFRPIGEVMSASPHVMSSSASAYDAALEMATHGVRHLLVVDAEERLLRVVSERDLFSLQRIGLRQIRAGMRAPVTSTPCSRPVATSASWPST